jgi:uncharacterized membrane protein (UPF0127 family)
MQKKSIIALVVAVILIGGAITIFILTRQTLPQVCFEKTCFTVEIADTEQEKATGYMHKTSIRPDEGMIFVYDVEEFYTFWMLNTSITLDMIWINKDLKVAHIKHSALPCIRNCDIFHPAQKAQYILEVKGGRAKQIGMELGDSVKFKNFE